MLAVTTSVSAEVGYGAVVPPGWLQRSTLLIATGLVVAGCGDIHWTRTPWDESTFAQDDADCMQRMKSRFGPAAGMLNIWHRTFYKNCMKAKGYEQSE